MKRSKLVIFDACTIIDAHRLNIWKQLINHFDVHVSSIVVHEEAKYFIGADGKRREINLADDIASKRISELEATAEEMATLSEQVKETFLQALDIGEREIMALLVSKRCSDYFFCTGDVLAIKSLAHFNVATQGVSLERLLDEAKIKCAKVPGNYSERAFKQQIATGTAEAAIARKPPKD